MQDLHDKALIYIQSDKYNDYDNLINEHYHFIENFLDSKEITFIYFPKLLNNEHFSKVMDYHYPYIKEFQHTDITPLYHQLIRELGVDVIKPGLVYTTEYSDNIKYFELPFPEFFNTHVKISKFLTEITEQINEIKVLSDRPMFRFDDDDFKSPLFEFEIRESTEKNTTDDNFATGAFEIPQELREQIREVQKSGHLTILIDYLQVLNRAARKLSRLKITNDNKIFFVDYDMKEVKMSPLPKALYFLFLRHPEGIMLKDMRDYRDELTEIYQNISFRENMDNIRKSIDNLTNPFDNSVNEKCSRIREAFIKVVAEEIAENYFITGKRAEPKIVKLNRELVIYE